MNAPEQWMEGWLNQEISPGDQTALMDWLRQNPGHRRTFLAAVALDEDLRGALALRTLSLGPLLTHRRRGRIFLATASAALILLAAGIAKMTLPIPEKPESAKPSSPDPEAPVNPFPDEPVKTVRWTNKMVLGWALSEGLAVKSMPRPTGKGEAIRAGPEGGQARRAYPIGPTTLTLAPQAEIEPSGPKWSGEDRICLNSGRVRAEVGGVRLVIDTPWGSFAGRQTQFTIQSDSLRQYAGLNRQTIELDVLKGEVAAEQRRLQEPFETATTIQTFTAGTRIRFTCHPDGRKSQEILPKGKENP